MFLNNSFSFYYFLISPDTIQFYSTVNNVLNKNEQIKGDIMLIQNSKICSYNATELLYVQYVFIKDRRIGLKLQKMSKI